MNEKLEKGLSLHRAGYLDEARAIYRAILDVEPANAEALHLSGLAAYQSGELAEAVKQIDAAIDADPQQAKYHSNRGNVAKAARELKHAERFYRRALEIDAAFHDARFNLGVLLQEAGELEEAALAYDDILAKSPENTDAMNNLGLVRVRQGRLKEAERCFKTVLTANPERLEIYLNLGQVHERLGRLPDAEADYRKAAEGEERRAEAYFNLGCILEQRRRPTKAIAALERAVAENPDYAEAKTTLRHQYMHACAWDKLGKLEETIDEADLRSGGDDRTAETPFFSVVRCDDPAQNLRVAKSWSQHLERHCRPLFAGDPSRERGRGERLRIGYLSNDFFDHATAHLMGGLFEVHDKKRFSIHAYSYGRDDGSHYRRKIADACNSFVDIREFDHARAARKIHADGIDILIDLKGWTQGNRLAICAHRPAPVQATYLGFPGSTGASFFDYAIVDPVVVPTENARHFSENLAFLPDCYQVNDMTQEISDTPVSRREFGLPENGVVFSCFNNPYKIEPEMFDLWMDLLDRVPESVLWLFAGNDLAVSNLRKAASVRGFSSDRLVFGEQLPKSAHLRRMQMADVALDTRVCNGHTTTSDALWAGIPVIALEGNHFASRVSASCLRAVGLSELIMPSREAYLETALRLAHDATARASLKARLWANRMREPLFETRAFTRSFESLLLTMWDRHANGAPPDEIRASPS
ncbi:MAG: tetratricopeptide repeat protein [Rhodospirillales bacterium]|nr:tetratricopeptide repeat protein [Rhodospirillales bacterium]